MIKIIFIALKKKISDAKKQAGFTLVEIMVATGIFALVVLVAVGAILAIIGANAKAQALNDVINNMNFAVESMVRDMRTGSQYKCVLATCPGKTNEISFQSTITPGTVDYRYDSANKAIIETSNDHPLGVPLTSSNIQVTRLDFYVSNTAAGYQPVILMILQAQSNAGGHVTQFNIQTLISQRELNI